MTFMLSAKHIDKKYAVLNGLMMNNSLPLVVMIISLWFGRIKNSMIQSIDLASTRLQ